jgi:hypothetical protein
MLYTEKSIRPYRFDFSRYFEIDIDFFLDVKTSFLYTFALIRDWHQTIR